MIFLALAASAAIAVTAVQLMRVGRAPQPPANAELQLLVLGTRHRTRFTKAQPGRWILTPADPLGEYRPIKAGDPVSVELEVEGGVRIYKASVERSDVSQLYITEPKSWKVRDRRERARLNRVGHLTAKIDGKKANLIDLSAGGARLRTQIHRPSGERVKLEIDQLDRAVEGWVVATEVKPTGYVLRVRFEDEANLGSIAKIA